MESSSLRAPHHLHTERLILRRPQPGDAPAIFAYASDAAVTRYLSWPRHESIEHTRDFLSFSDAEWHTFPAGPYLIELRASGRVLGGTGLKFSPDASVETGYVLAADAWGKGYATESVTAMAELCTLLGVRNLFARCHPGHLASQRVLQKCGFEPRQGVIHSLVFPNLDPSTPQRVLSYTKPC